MNVRLLLAGFQGAPGASAAATLLLDAVEGAGPEGGPVQGIDATVVRLPASHDSAPGMLAAALREKRPDLFLLVGTDPASTEYKLHLFAANYADDPRPDVDGKVLQDTILDPDGPVAYRSRVPLDGIWDKLLVERVPVRMSHKAGLWLFNHVYYRALRTIDLEGLPTRAGALETPPLVGEEVDGAEPRSGAQLEEEIVMVLAVLAQIAPAGGRGKGAEGRRDG